MNIETLLILLSATACAGASFQGEENGSERSYSDSGAFGSDSGGGLQDSESTDIHEAGNGSNDSGTDAASLPSPSVCLAGFSALSCAAICVSANGSTGCGSILECYRKNDCAPEDCGASPGNICYGTGLAAIYADQAYKECCK